MAVTDLAISVTLHFNLHLSSKLAPDFAGCQLVICMDKAVKANNMKLLLV